MARPTRRPGESSPQGLYQLGVQGRKTGAKLKDDGKRDSQGMMPTEGLFSSPGGNATQKLAVPTENPIPEATPPPDGNDDASVPMDIASSGGPGPGTVLRQSRNFELPLPKSRSPGKTTAKSLRSPAKRHPNISPLRPSPDPAARHIDLSSPSRKSSRPRFSSTIREIPSDDYISEMVNESTEMGNANLVHEDYRGANEYRPSTRPHQPLPPMSEKARGKQKAVPSKSPSRPLPRKPAPPREPSPRHSSPPQFPNESSLYVQDPEPEPEPGPEPEVQLAQPSFSPPTPAREPSAPIPSPRPKTHNRSTGAVSTAGSARRRPRDEEEDRRDRAKRQRQTESVLSRRSEQPAKRRPGRPPKNGVAKRGRGRPRKSEVESDGEEGDSLIALQRGPPMPKSRGLVSMRRDTAAAVENRRRGNDADWWADLQNNDTAYDYNQRLSPQAATKHRRRPAAAIADEEEELEDWEVDPGSLEGEIVLWEPEHEANPPGPDDTVQVTDERIAITADAIQMVEIRDSDARYAKPLTMPFMGAGLVDLPPGSEKRPKNSRKMHLVFFVHYGKVTVSINEVQFRISAGGMFFVPRGNYYNIANDYDFPARVYFAQACEVSASSGPTEDMTQTIVT